MSNPGIVTNPDGAPKVDINDYFDRIAPFLRIGCSLNEACLEADVPVQTAYEYHRYGAEGFIPDPSLKVSEEKLKLAKTFRKKVDAAMQFSVTVARQTVFEVISGKKDADGQVLIPKDPRLAFDYLRSKRPDEFAQKSRVEHEGKVTVDYGKEFEEEIERFSKPYEEDAPMDNQGMDGTTKSHGDAGEARGIHPTDVGEKV
jgi:hypothetical protein